MLLFWNVQSRTKSVFFKVLSEMFAKECNERAAVCWCFKMWSTLLLIHHMWFSYLCLLQNVDCWWYCELSFIKLLSLVETGSIKVWWSLSFFPVEKEPKSLVMSWFLSSRKGTQSVVSWFLSSRKETHSVLSVGRMLLLNISCHLGELLWPLCDLSGRKSV